MGRREVIHGPPGDVVPLAKYAHCVCMSRVNIYLPRDLAEQARAADLNVSAIAQEALEQELRRRSLFTWLEEVGDLPSLTDGPGLDR